MFTKLMMFGDMVAPCSFEVLSDNTYSISNGLADEHRTTRFSHFFLLGKCSTPINILNGWEGKYSRGASKHLYCELTWILRTCVTKLSRRTNLLEEKNLWEQFLTLAVAKTESTGKERYVYSS